MINKKYCRQELTTHQDYPALTAVTDFLYAGGMAYMAAQADASYINEFNYPLLAHIKQPGQEYMHIIQQKQDWEKEKVITQHWSGIVLFAEKKTKWHNAENEKQTKEVLANNIFLALVFVMLTAFYLFAVWHTPLFTYAVFGLFSVTGLLVSVLITGSELGVQHSILKQVCGTVSIGGCDAVLKTRYAKGIAGISMGDMAILYFSTQFLSFCSAIINPAVYNALLWISLGGVLVAAWSIYTQAAIIKQWCALCLCVAAVLLVQCIIAIFSVSFAKSTVVMPAFAAIAGIAMAMALILLPIKRLLTANHLHTQQLAELKKWKMDAGLFLAQWQNEPAVDTTVWTNDLLIGNPDAPIKITVACNPYCGPCAKAHEQLDKMLEKYAGKLCVQVRFLCNAANEEDKRTIAVKAILKKATEIKDNKELAAMLSSWFELMDYDKWMAKQPPLSPIDVNHAVQQHEQWVSQSQIAVTPTFFVNGKKIPGRYGLKEFAELIPQLSESFAIKDIA